tara:strand:- start:244 stop:468 length:225 start_codon:yes stop_codon:yes gene_type:complete
MKTMANQDNSVVVRVSEEEANILRYEGFHYVPKSEWKTFQERQRGQSEFTPTISKKSNKMSKSTKRHLRNQNKK